MSSRDHDAAFAKKYGRLEKYTLSDFFRDLTAAHIDTLHLKLVSLGFVFGCIVGCAVLAVKYMVIPYMFAASSGQETAVHYEVC